MSRQDFLVARQGGLYHNDPVPDIDPKQMTVPARVIAVRLALGMIPADFARKLEISTGRLNNWMSGRNDPGKEGAQKIEDATGVGWGWIFQGKRKDLPGDIFAEISPDLLERAAEEAEERRLGRRARARKRSA